MMSFDVSTTVSISHSSQLTADVREVHFSLLLQLYVLHMFVLIIVPCICRHLTLHRQRSCSDHTIHMIYHIKGCNPMTSIQAYI